jgi:hypothetical protein
LIISSVLDAYAAKIEGFVKNHIGGEKEESLRPWAARWITGQPEGFGGRGFKKNVLTAGRMHDKVPA